MKKLIVIALIFCSIATYAQKGSTSTGSSSQSKRAMDTWGLGFKIESGASNFGFDLGYAINHSMSIGTDFGIGYIGGYTTEGVETKGFMTYSLAPYVKYYMEQGSNYFPFIKAQVAIGKGSDYLGRGVNYTNFRALGGMEWFPISSVSLGGGVSLIEYNTDKGQLSIGTLYPFLNIMWWM